MLALTFKDLKSIFLNIEIYICFGIVLLLAGFFFFSNLSSYNTLVALQANLASTDLKNLSLESQVLNYYWFSVAVIGIFSSSFIAIKLIDEEKETRMYGKIVRTIGIFKFILSKAITVALLNLVQSILFLILPLILSITNIVWVPQILLAIVGIFISLTIYSMTAIFITTLTRGVWLASLASICLILVSYFCYSVSLKLMAPFSEIFRYISILTHQQKFISGLFSFQSFVLGVFVIFSMFMLSIYFSQRNSRV